YLDWYLVDDFTALGALNEAAVSGTRQPSHDAVAALARAGTGGVARLLGGEPVVPGAPVVTMLDKPGGTSHAAFVAPLAPALARSPARASAWMRQMTLGPGREFIVLADGEPPALPWPATDTMEATVVAG